MATRGRSAGLGMFVLGMLFAPALLALAVTAYLKLGSPPVAVADHLLPFEKLLLRRPVNKRVDRELTGPPFGTDEAAFVAAAHTYVAHCASCHGTPDHDAALAEYMYPLAPQLWRNGGPGTSRPVTQSETGRTYWKIANGIRLSGMPAYSQVLTDTEVWQLALLLRHADDGLPAPVMTALKQ